MSDGQGFGGFAGFLQSMRPAPDEVPDPLTRALLAPDKPDPEPLDDDERQAGLLARRYAPGMASDLAQRLADVTADLEACREANEKASKAQERIARDHAAGRISAHDIMRKDVSEPDVAREQHLERRKASLERQMGEAQAAIAPQQQRDADPLEAATRRAHQAFRETTRAKMAGAAQSRPARRPKGSVSRGLGDGHFDVPDCAECIAAGATADESLLIHNDPELALPVPDDWTPDNQAVRREAVISR